MFRQATRIPAGFLASVVVASCANVPVAGIREGKEDELPGVELHSTATTARLAEPSAFTSKFVVVMANGIQTENHHS